MLSHCLAVQASPEVHVKPHKYFPTQLPPTLEWLPIQGGRVIQAGTFLELGCVACVGDGYDGGMCQTLVVLLQPNYCSATVLRDGDPVLASIVITTKIQLNQ